jgi:putative phosphoesterase
VIVAVISDTHGFLHPDLGEKLAGVDAILHAGDVGGSHILDFLTRFGPVQAVRGNVDRDPPLSQLPQRLALKLEERLVLLTHIGPFSAAHSSWLEQEIGRAVPDVFICGHSHIPRCERIDGMLHFNPGAAGRTRFGRPPSFGLLTISATALEASLLPLRSI